MIVTAHAGSILMDYCRFGNGKRNFVIIPGLSIKPVAPSEAMLQSAFSDFMQDFTVYLFDRRTNIPENYSIEEMAEDTAEVMNSLGLDIVSIFGASQGGAIAQAIALNHPEIVEKIVVGSTSSRTNDEITRTVNKWIALAQSGDGYGLNRAIFEQIYSTETFSRLRDAFLLMGEGITVEDLDRFVTVASSLLSFDFYERLGGLGSKMLVIGCEADSVFGPQASREIAEKAGCQLFMYGSEYGHAVYDEAPDYRKHMLDFLLQ